MTIKILENGFIADEYEFGEEPFIFKDAIVMLEEEYNLLSEQDIQSIKQQRYDNWMLAITTPPEKIPVVDQPTPSQDPAIEFPPLYVIENNIIVEEKNG